MTPLEQELSAELRSALALRPDAELVLDLDASTLVGGKTVRGAALLVSSPGASPLRMFAPWSLFASALVKSFAGWGPEYGAKLKAHQQ